MIVQIFNVIVALATISKTFKAAIEKIVELWTDKKIHEYRQKVQVYSKSRSILIKKMQEAQNDEERIALSIAIDAINHGKQMQ